MNGDLALSRLCDEFQQYDTVKGYHYKAGLVNVYYAIIGLVETKLSLKIRTLLTYHIFNNIIILI